MQLNIDDIRKKVKQLRHMKCEEALAEIASLEERLHTMSPFGPELKPYNPHRVRIESKDCIAFDARYLNRYAHHRGRGDYRYIFQDNEMIGIAVHTPTKEYRKVA